MAWVSRIGYLVDEMTVVTCEHVIRPAQPGDEVELTIGAATLTAMIDTRLDADADCAVLTLKKPLKGVRRWNSPRSASAMLFGTDMATRVLAKIYAVPLQGTVMDPKGIDKKKQTFRDPVFASGGHEVGYSRLFGKPRGR